MTILERYGAVLRCYDNGGKSADRYTIVPPRWANEYRHTRENGWDYGTAEPWIFDAIGSGPRPFHPQGVGMHTSAMPGPHLGRRIKWSDLPRDVQVFARDVFPEYAPKEAA
jgi:hypothetical protein